MDASTKREGQGHMPKLIIARITHQRWIRDDQVVAEREFWETRTHDPEKPPRNHRTEIDLADGTKLIEETVEFGQFTFDLEGTQ